MPKELTAALDRTEEIDHIYDISELREMLNHSAQTNNGSVNFDMLMDFIRYIEFDEDD